MFKVQKTLGSMRAGYFETKKGLKLSTPCLLQTSNRGTLPYITHDLLSKTNEMGQLPIQAVQLGQDLIESPKLDTLEKVVKSRTSESSTGISMIGSYLGYDALSIEKGSRPTLIFSFRGSNPPFHDKATKLGVTVSTFTGRRIVSPDNWCEWVLKAQPDLAVVLEDEVPAISSTSVVSKKRCIKSRERTIDWATTILATLSTQTGQTPPLLLSVEGGRVLEERKACIDSYVSFRSNPSLSKVPIAGFKIGGFGSGESQTDRETYLSQIMEALPSEGGFIRYLPGLTHPLELIYAVEKGIDILDGGYALTLTEIYQAATFSLHQDQPISSSVTLDLKSETLARDSSPLLPGCPCFTCTNHSRAYIHHLTNTQELLGPILLQLHNLYHLEAFVTTMRTKINSAESSIDDWNVWKSFIQSQFKK